MREASLAIIFDDAKQILVKRRDVPVWVLPGGGIEPGESSEQAAEREVWEETGLRVNIVRKTGAYTPINRLAAPTYVYECRVRDGLMRTGCETSEIAFWSLDKLPYNLFIVHRDWLEDALKNPLSPVQKKIERVTYWGLACYGLCHPLILLRFIWTRLSKS